MTDEILIPKTPLKLDLGCGKNKAALDFTGVDCRPFEGVDLVVNLAEKLPPYFDVETISDNKQELLFKLYNILNEPPKFKPWPWEDNSVDEIHSSHFVEHLGAMERVHFVNECYRILKPGAQAKIVIPHWCSSRAYGDLDHKMPPVVEFWFYYLSKSWRDQNAPHNDFYKCDFACTWGYSLREDVLVRNQEYQMFAMSNFKEVCQDIIATMTKSV